MTSETSYTTLGPGKQAQILADLMDLFHSNERGYGLGEFEGARFDEDKNKWYPGHVRWTWGKTEKEQWHEHLAGVRLLGQGVLCDDGKVWYTCLDVDVYEIDYNDEMCKIKSSDLPLVVFRTKSGGLRVTVFFSEPIESETVIPRMKHVAAVLGYAGCEIFPKQTKLVLGNGRDDCPSWIFMPFGGMHDMFPEQGCMTDNGGLMDLSDAVSHMKNMRISRNQFMKMFSAEEAAKANGKANGKKNPKGTWVEEISYDLTLNTTFYGGPPCLWIIAHRKSTEMRNNFLHDVRTFLMKKYPENWQKPLEWVNFNVLSPPGDAEKLHGLITRRHEYEYKCSEEPICAFCHSESCRKQPYGVGNSTGIDYYELGLTEVMRIPRIFYANVGDTRIQLAHDELTNQNKFRDKCVAYGIPAPPRRKNEDWDNYIRKGMDDSTKVEPTHIMRTGAAEIEFLTRYFDIHVPNFIRWGEKGNKDLVRVKEEEKRIYFKADKLMTFCRQCNFEEDRMRRFIDNNCQYHDKKTYRDWLRCTYSASFSMFDEEKIEMWLATDKEPGG